MRNALLLLVIGCFTTLLNGCSSHAVDINGQDENVSMPEGEVVVSLGSSIPQGPNRRDNTLSIGYSRGVGQFEQDINSSEYVDLRGSQIHGPAMLDSEAELGVGYLRFVRHMFVRESFEWYWGAGLGHSTLKLSVSDGTQTMHDENNATGPHGLVGLAYYFHPMFGFEGNIGGYYFPSDDPSSLTDLRAQLVFTPAGAVRLYAGYRYWGYRYQPSNSSSDVLLDFYGPTVGMTLHF